MSKKIRFAVLAAAVVVSLTVVVYFAFFTKQSNTLVSPLARIQQELATTKREGTVFQNDLISVLLVGTDISSERRANGQYGFNTDTMILVSANPQTNRVLLTSIPRDLWINGNKLNALHIAFGEETLVDAFEQVTGLQVDGVVRADFDAFTWLVDSFGGLPVNVQTSFSDYSFPNNLDSGIVTVSFEQGTETMNGERALTFARSRKGTNGEGSDLMRAKRQHLLLQSMLTAVAQPKSIFWPMNIENFYNLVTAPGKMETTLTLADVRYLWDFYKDRDDYSIESFVVDDAYVYHPGLYPASDYTAWVFIPKEPGWNTLHSDILAKLNGTPPATTTAELTQETPIPTEHSQNAEYSPFQGL